jgi:hypothetical protein
VGSAAAYDEGYQANARSVVNVAECWPRALTGAMWDFLAYFSLLIAVAYIAFILWSILRGSLDQGEDPE